MPKIPKVKPAQVNHDITSDEHAAALARSLAGASKAGDRDKFASIVRKYLLENKEARIAIRRWYEAL